MVEFSVGFICGVLFIIVLFAFGICYDGLENIDDRQNGEKRD